MITFIASLLRGTTQGNMTSQRERTVAEMTHAQPWLPSPTADPHSHDCYMNTSHSMHNTQSRLPVSDNDVTSIATIGTFEAVVFLFFKSSQFLGHGSSVQPLLSENFRFGNFPLVPHACRSHLCKKNGTFLRVLLPRLCSNVPFAESRT